MNYMLLLPAETSPLAALALIAFSFLGFVLTQWLVLVAAMIVSGLLGTWMGKGLLQRLPEEAFRQIFRAVLTVLAVRLLFKSILT